MNGDVRDYFVKLKGSSSMFFICHYLANISLTFLTFRFIKYLPRTDIGVLKVTWVKDCCFSDFPSTLPLKSLSNLSNFFFFFFKFYRPIFFY